MKKIYSALATLALLLSLPIANVFAEKAIDKSHGKNDKIPADKVESNRPSAESDSAPICRGSN